MKPFHSCARLQLAVLVHFYSFFFFPLLSIHSFIPFFVFFSFFFLSYGPGGSLQNLAQFLQNPSTPAQRVTDHPALRDLELPLHLDTALLQRFAADRAARQAAAAAAVDAEAAPVQADAGIARQLSGPVWNGGNKKKVRKKRNL